ncbi:MAG: dephospho-CoA kinase [candidate division Zixibacteria bacterium]|nr:dephospho-CoA kinase [candidate division Zixibacteria bacterium]
MSGHDVVVIDAALMLDWRLDRQVDITIVVHASRARRFALAEKRGITPDDARARQRRQLPYSEYRRRADVVILNNGSKNDLRRKLDSFWRKVILKEIRRKADT